MWELDGLNFLEKGHANLIQFTDAGKKTYGWSQENLGPQVISPNERINRERPRGIIHPVIKISAPTAMKTPEPQ